MKRHWPLVLSTLTAVALSACATSPLANASAADARVEAVASAMTDGTAAAAADPAASQAASVGTGAPAGGAGSSSARFSTDDAVPITLGDQIVIGGPGATVSGNTVTITDAGAYRIAGTLADGQVVVRAADNAKVTLVLEGARISSSSGAPLAVMSDTDLTLVLADGSESFLSDAASYVLPAGADEPNGALFAKGDLTIDGAGALTIDAKYQHAIRGKDDITIDGGNITLTSKGDAVNSNNDLTLNSGRISISAGDDALHADLKLTINDGSISIGRSYEAIESEQITINGGTIYAASSNDAINISAAGAAPAGGGRGAPAAGTAATAAPRLLTINGGYVVLDASAGDGLDSNGSISMTGGTVIVHGAPINMEAPIDYDASFTMTGGTIVAAGSAGMAQAPGGTSTQNSVMVTFPAMQPAGTLVHLAGEDGKNVLTFAPPKAFQSLVLSSPDLRLGATYRVSTGGSAAGTPVDGLYAAGPQSAGTEFVSFTVTGPVTRAGAAGVARVGRR
uniref:Carbohydrate-binding domain-containing protein n=1 Tax=uncultured Armatimonadetes bacterium TaxID=157466 RepID=A0A6J4JIX4_9BACT|nr:hypothetical protein AVDCRST_MAG63-3508 [uncultured Armatimonadetes bacterium]